MNKTLLIVMLSMLATSEAIGGAISGQAVDLEGRTIPNVNIQAFSVNGRVANRTFADGAYNVPINNASVPNTNQGLTVIFSAPGRETVTVNLHARSANSLNVVLPERRYGAPCVQYSQPCYRRPIRCR